VIRIHAGFEIAFDCIGPTPMMLQLSIHPSRAGDLVTPDQLRFDPPIPSSSYLDGFGNTVTRIVAPAGRLTMASEFDVMDSGLADVVDANIAENRVEDLPDDVLVYLLGSRYCETDRLSDTAWSLFGTTRPGWARVQAICDFVHKHIKFDYLQARDTRSAWEGYQEGVGVCRDFAHLAVAFCRCMNIPARYCTGYLGDIGLPPPYAAGDFSAWFEAYLGDRWYTFDARHNTPRIGRVLMGRGRDATDCAISTNFGKTTLAGFHVICDEVVQAAATEGERVTQPVEQPA
jgi:transglutaminase-like putative cysteine protease